MIIRHSKAKVSFCFVDFFQNLAKLKSADEYLNPLCMNRLAEKLAYQHKATKS